MTVDTAIRSTGFFTDDLAASDPAVAKAINHELKRERKQIELIASENIVSKAVLIVKDDNEDIASFADLDRTASSIRESHFRLPTNSFSMITSSRS